MPYTRITPTKNGREAIEYAMSGAAHEGKGKRNVLVGAVGMAYSEDAAGYAEQMETIWRRASSRNKTQIRRIITSYSKDELDPDDPKSAEIALAVAMEHAKAAYYGRQTLICVQKDGRGGCLHVHELVSNVSMIDNTGCTNEQTKFSYVAQTVDEVAKRYLEISMEYEDKFDEKGRRKQKGVGDVQTQNERRMRDQNAEAKSPVNYVWKDDLKERVRAAMSEATDREDYLKRLTAHGVEGEYRTSKKQGDYIIYELTDTTGFGSGKMPPNLKSKSYKLGGDYGLEALEMALEARTEKPQTKTTVQTTKPPKQLTPEEQAKNEETAKYIAWAKTHGYDDVINLEGHLSIKRIDEAQAAYAAYKKAQETVASSVEAPEPEAAPVQSEIIEPPHRARKSVVEQESRQKEEGSKKPENANRDNSADIPQSVALRTALMQKLIDDIEAADGNQIIAELYDEDDDRPFSK